MAQPKSYFLAPDFDCPPNTAIRIGHILTSPTTPYESLNHDSLLSIPPSILISTTKTGFTVTRSQLHSGSYGIWAQILEGAYGTGISFGHEKSQEVSFAIEELETSFIQPSGGESKEFIRRSMENEGVREFFEGSRWRKCVYMIVGLKIAKGAKISKGSKKSKDGALDLMVDGTAVGVPGVKVGPKVEGKVERGEGVEWEDEKSFVFAYRLRKIVCKKGKVKSDEAFSKGAFLDAGSGENGDESEVNVLVGEDDVGAEEGSGIVFAEDEIAIDITK